MRGGGAQYGVGSSEIAVHRFESPQEASQRAGTDRHVQANLHAACAEAAGHDGNAGARVRMIEAEHLFRQGSAEAPMRLAQALGGRGAAGQPTVVHPALHGDVRNGFQLQVPGARVRAVVVSQRPLDVDRVRVVPLDQVAVVAVHRADEIGERRGHPPGQAPPKPRGAGREIDGQIRQRAAVR